MAPEYNKVYIPPEQVDEFESFVGKIESATIGRKILLKKEFPPPTAEALGINELGQKAKIVIDQLPVQTPIRDFTMWNFAESTRRKDDVHSPQAWLEFMHSLNLNDKKLVTRVIDRLRMPQGQTIDELREINWAKAPRPYGVGVKGMAFLSTAFSK